MPTPFREYPDIPVNVEPDVPHWVGLALQAVDKDVQAVVDRLTGADRDNLLAVRKELAAVDARKVDASRELVEATVKLNAVSGDAQTARSAATAAAISAEEAKNGAQANDAGVAAFLRTGEKTLAAVDRIMASTVSQPLPSRSARPLVVFTFDDGWARDVSVVEPILDAAGVKASFCIIASLPGTSASRLTWPQIKALEFSGHEIVNHSLTHASLGDSTDAALIRREVRDSHAIFLSHGIRPAGFCWAGQRSTATARRSARELYKYALGGTGARTQPFGTYEIRRETLNGTRDLEQLKRVVDNAKTNNELLIFLTHSTPEDLDETGLANLRGIIKYVQASGVPIVTAGEAFASVGNLLDTEGTVIDGTGRIYPSADSPGASTPPPADLAVYGGPALAAAATPESFPLGKISYHTTTNAANTDWPEPGFGNITTERANGTNYAFTVQEFTSAAGNRHSRRATSLTKWGPWVNLSGNHFVVPSASANYLEDPASAYRTGTTLQMVSGSPASSPSGGPGLLITHRVAPRFTVQEFQADNGGQFYRRTVNFEDAWRPFAPA